MSTNSDSGNEKRASVRAERPALMKQNSESSADSSIRLEKKESFHEEKATIDIKKEESFHGNNNIIVASKENSFHEDPVVAKKHESLPQETRSRSSTVDKAPLQLLEKQSSTHIEIDPHEALENQKLPLQQLEKQSSVHIGNGPYEVLEKQASVHLEAETKSIEDTDSGNSETRRHESGRIDPVADVETGIISPESVFVSSSSIGDYATGDRTLTFSPAAPENSPTVLTFSNIVVTTKQKPHKILLNNVSGSITGGFWAVMGGSGGGKTTLLSTLSLRLDTAFMDIKGEFRLNGREYSRATLKSMSAYVMQDDLLHAELTVQETLSYAARLRMPTGTSFQQRQARIDEILQILGIAHTKSVIIGNTRRKGVSGGERKRVSVAVELLNRPKLVFLDEPTSGLDSSTALSVCQALKNLTLVGECTVVATIHQPQPKIFALFDNLMLMKKGNLIYQGSASKVDRFLEQLGFPTPSDMSIADHLLDVISPHNELGEVINDTANKQIIPVNLSLGMDKDIFELGGAQGFFAQFYILFQRNLQQYLRNSDIIFMNVSVTVLLAVFIGRGLWYHIGTGQDSIPKRVPSLFFACVTQGIVGALQAVNSFPSERAIMLRERQAGAYNVSSYFLAKTAVDILTQTWPPILFSLIVYFMIGYQPVASKFFYYTFFMVLDTWAATSVATAVSCFCVSVELSTIVLALLFEICRLFGGFFASPTQVEAIPNWKFADALSFVKYAFLGVAINELTGLELSCNKPSGCKVTKGSQIMATNGYDDYTIGFCIGILFVLIVGSRLLAYLGLRFIKM